MTQQIPENLLADLSRFILENTGLYFSRKKFKALNKGLTSAARALDFSPRDFASDLLRSPPADDTINTIVGYLTIGETYFLRDKNQFQVLVDTILSDLIRERKATGQDVNIWSAGCATGEEPYSIAILIDHSFPSSKNRKINIFGSDINPAFLKKAYRGVYGRWSLRETPQQIIDDYFVQKGENRFELIPSIKKRVRFFQLNLMAKSYPLLSDIPGRVDIILCRNVLMYFNDKSRKGVVQRLSARLAENGWLITGPAEAGFVRSPDLVPIRFANTLFYQKQSGTKASETGLSLRRKPDSGKAEYASGPPREKFRKRTETNQPPGVSPGGDDYDAYQKAIANYEKGNYRKAAASLSGLLEKGGNRERRFLMKIDAMILAARAYANAGDLEKARYWCEKTIQSEKLNPEIYFLRSTIAQAADDTAAGISSLRQALYLDPEFIMAHFNLGLLFKQGNRTEDARKSMENALALLETRDGDETLPYSEGITVKRLIETIRGLVHNRWHEHVETVYHGR